MPRSLNVQQQTWCLIITALCFLLLLLPNMFGTKYDFSIWETCAYALLFWSILYAFSPRLFAPIAWLASLWWAMSLFLTWQSSVKINPTFLGMLLNTHPAEIYDFFSMFGWWLLGFLVWLCVISMMLIYVYRQPSVWKAPYRAIIILVVGGHTVLQRYIFSHLG